MVDHKAEMCVPDCLQRKRASFVSLLVVEDLEHTKSVRFDESRSVRTLAFSRKQFSGA